MHRVFKGAALSSVMLALMVNATAAAEDSLRAVELFDKHREVILSTEKPSYYSGYVFITVQAKLPEQPEMSKHEKRRAINSQLGSALISALLRLATKECKDKGLRVKASAPLDLRRGAFQLVFQTQRLNGSTKVYSGQAETLRGKLMKSCVV